jgi:hypothetical protein
MEDREWWETTAWSYVRCPRCKREPQQFCTRLPEKYHKYVPEFAGLLFERIGHAHDERITAALLLTGGTKEGAYRKFYCEPQDMTP